VATPRRSSGRWSPLKQSVAGCVVWVNNESPSAYISILIEQLLYPLINIKKVLPSFVDLVGKVKAFKGFDALPYVLDRIASDVVVPNEIRRPIPLT
jgi:hypothetical protein